jgi:DNA-binding transcriptional regulator YiaG
MTLTTSSLESEELILFLADDLLEMVIFEDEYRVQRAEINHLDEEYLRIESVKRKVDPQHISVLIQYLKEQSNLLDLASVQLSQQIVQFYSNQLSQPITEEVVLPNIQLFIKDIFNRQDLWTVSARDIWANLILWIMEEMERTIALPSPTGLNRNNFHLPLAQLLCDRQSLFIRTKIQRLEEFYSRIVAKKLIQDLDLLNYSNQTIQTLLGLHPDRESTQLLSAEESLGRTEKIALIPTGLPIVSSVSAQLYKEQWQPDASGIAYFRYISRRSQTNYLEHYISNSQDITKLPWEAAEQIINKFGFNTVKLQFIFAAHAMKQAAPWESTFTIKATDIIQELGWDRNHSTDLPTKRNEIANIAYALSCLLVKAVWMEGRGKTRINASTPVGRMWEVLINPQGQLDWATGRIDKPNEVYLTVRPGLWTTHFLNQAGSKAKDALHQFGYLALSILQIDPYHDELALRLAIHLTLEARVGAQAESSYTYTVRSLLQSVLPTTTLQAAQENREKARSLFDRWNHAVKLLAHLGWLSQQGSDTDPFSSPNSVFYVKPYPDWLIPENSIRKPRGWVQDWLDQSLVMQPPHPIPEQDPRSQMKPGRKKSLPAHNQLSGTDIRTARKAKKWTQAQLADALQVHQSLVARLESGDRTPSSALEETLRQLLNL